MQCPDCQKPNPDNSQFCQHCGFALPTGAVATATSMQPNMPRPVAPVGQMGTGGTNAGSIWGPFAGYGERGRHVSWLIDGKGEFAQALHQAVTERFGERSVPQSRMNWVNLSGQGILVERRPFYFIRRGITTVAIHIGGFGKDLYISQVTYAKGPINNLRVGVLAAMVLFQLYYIYGFGSSLVGVVNGLNVFNAGSGIGSLFFLLCVVGPLGLVNGLLLLLTLFYSLYKWLKEKDFWSILRTPPNEFQLDDIVALEKSVEETIRESLDKVNLNSALLVERPNSNFGVRVI